MKDCKDRNEQFEKIHELKEEYSKSENPIISISTSLKISTPHFLTIHLPQTLHY